MPYGFLVLVVIDQITKTVSAGRDFFFLWFHFHPVANYALPFGVDFGRTVNFLMLSAVYLAVGWQALRLASANRLVRAGRVMFLSGAASNLADRMVYGYVRDFIDLGLGAVFNLADLLIVVGLMLLLPAALRVEKRPPIVGSS